MVKNNFYLLTDYLNSNLLTNSCYQSQIKLANPKLFIKEIFYLFEYAAISQNQYYNHLAFSFIEELIFSVNQAKIEQSNWSVPLISLFLTKFNQLGYFNLAISKIYRKADEISILIINNKELRQDQLVLILIYLEQRVKENNSLISVLQKAKKILSKEKLFNIVLPFDELLRSAVLLKLLCFESNEILYKASMDMGLKLLTDKFEDDVRSGITLRKMLFLFDDDLKFVGENFLVDFMNNSCKSLKERILLSETIMKRNLENEQKSSEFHKNTLHIMEKELNTLDFSNKLDLGFDILMTMPNATLQKRGYYSLLN